MSNKTIFILLLLVIVFVGGCVKVPATSSPFKGNISFRIEERFTEQFDGPHLYLVVSTEQIYNCAYFGHNLSTDSETVKVILGEIIKPDACSAGPARFDEDLNIKKSEYSLEFYSKDKIDKYMVKISKDSVIIEPVEATFSKIEQTKIKRIPENLLWAQCFYNGDWKYNPNDDFCKRFFNEIEIIAPPYLTAEEGKMPENQFYLYRGEDQAIISLIKKYNRENYYVRISTWKGKTFICPFNCDKPGIAYVPKLEVEYPREPITNISVCGKDVVCIMEVAFNTKNETICELLPEENRGQCFGQVGIAKLDKKLCAKTGNCFTCQQECYSYIESWENNTKKK
jgi:hypothetical protein